MAQPTSLPNEGLEPAERRREALRLSLERASMTPAEAAREANLTSANSLYNFLRGRSHSLSTKTLEALARVVPGATFASLGGVPSQPGTVDDGGGHVIVQVEIRAGTWRPSLSLPLAEQVEVPVPLKPGLRSSGAFGAMVRNPGANLLYPDDTILVCVPAERYEGRIGHGSVVLLERLRDKRVEVTVRQLQRFEDAAWLWQRCDHPDYQTPVRMPWPPQNRSWQDGAERLRLAGVVCLSVRPEEPAVQCPEAAHPDQPPGAGDDAA